MDYYAHKRVSEDGTIEYQTVEQHCRNSAAYAAECLKSVNLSEAGYLAGLIHDAGKFKQEFQNYLLHDCGVRGSVNHTFAGCRMLLEHFHADCAEDYCPVTGEVLAYAVGAHHGQFDCVDENRTFGFLHRLQKENIGYEESRDNFLAHCAGWKEIDQRFQAAHTELKPIYEKLLDLAEKNGDETCVQMMFSMGQLVRLILSSVIEGDRRDTAEFMEGNPVQKTLKTDTRFWNQYLERVEEKLRRFPRETEIQRMRGKISDLCREAADRPAGIYRLNVPTGGGKTLSALRYALAHAAKWEKQRIIFVTPLLAILEQNAAVIRDFMGDDSVIVEHHSNVIQTESCEDMLDLRELAVESWDAPVLITTLVQLLNTLFLGKTTSIRRYQALCNAVVVIDEVQTVPNHMLSLFNTAVNFLSSVCGTTFLLCSATQPCFDEAEHPLWLNQFSELIAYQEDIWKPFHRTEIRDAGMMRLNEIPDFARNILEDTQSMLIICNKKSESEFLYQSLASEETDCYHLSSSMCMAHRRDVLGQISKSLDTGKKTGRKTVCVSTQVMEAGVDVSFGCVIRLAAGMDSVIQAAGRCNRNGESAAPAPVYLLQCADENLGKLREIRDGKQVTVVLLEQFRRSPEQFGSDLSSDRAIEWYYRELYRTQPERYQQYTVEGGGTIFDMLSSNMGFLDMNHPDFGKFTINQAFKTAGELFHVLDDATEDVVVPYGAGAELIAELASDGGQVSTGQLRSWLKRAKPYTVSLYDYQKKKLNDGIVSIRGVLVLRPEYYDMRTGLITKPESTFLEV